MSATDTTDTEISHTDEVFSRSISLIGKESFDMIGCSKIIVVGLGGVGSNATNALARTGFRNLTLVDFDKVTMSSLNRHAVASLEDVGQNKADVMKKYILKYSPSANIVCINEFLSKTNINTLIPIDGTKFVLDCIDDVDSKCDLISYCLSNNIKIISSMGAGARVDGTKVHIGTLDHAQGDGIAYKLRNKLRKLRLDYLKMDIVYSSEDPVAGLLPLDGKETSQFDGERCSKYMRVRIIPVVSSVPSIFGINMASYVLSNICNITYSPVCFPSLSSDYLQKMVDKSNQRNKKLYGDLTPSPLNAYHADYLIKTIYKCRCPISGLLLGQCKMIIAKWHKDRPFTKDNMVFMKLESANHHHDNDNSWPPEIVEKVESLLSKIDM